MNYLPHGKLSKTWLYSFYHSILYSSSKWPKNIIKNYRDRNKTKFCQLFFNWVDTSRKRPISNLMTLHIFLHTSKVVNITRVEGNAKVVTCGEIKKQKVFITCWHRPVLLRTQFKDHKISFQYERTNITFTYSLRYATYSPPHPIMAHVMPFFFPG